MTSAADHLSPIVLRLCLIGLLLAAWFIIWYGGAPRTATHFGATTSSEEVDDAPVNWEETP